MEAPVGEPKKLTPEEAKQIHGLHRQAQDIVHAIGQAEVHKAKLLSQLADVEKVAHETIDAFGARLGIAPGTAWHLTPDGTVVMIDPKTGQPLPPSGQ